MRAVTLILGLLLFAVGAAAQEVDQDGLYREPFLVVDPGMHTASIRRMDRDREGRYLVTGSRDKTVRVWSAADGRLLRSIRVPAGPGEVGKIYAVAMSPDGETVAAGGWTGQGAYSIYLFDRASGRMLGRIGDRPSATLHLAFSPDGSKLAATFADNHGVRLDQTRSWRQIAADGDYGDASYGLAFARDGRIATTSDDGNIRLYGPMLEGKRTAAAPDGKGPFGIAFSPDGNRIAIGYDDTAKVSLLDGRSLVKLFSPDIKRVDNGDLGEVAWSADGQTLLAAGGWTVGGTRHVRSWSDSGRGAAADHPLAKNTIMTLLPLADGRMAAAAADPRVVMTDRRRMVVWQAEPLNADFRNQRNKLSLSADGARVWFGFEPFGNSPARFDLRQRRLDTDPPPDAALAAPRTSGLDVKGWQNTDEPTLAGSRLELRQHETSRSLAVAPDGGSFVLGAEYYLRSFDSSGKLLWARSGPSVAWAVNISGDGRLAVAAYGDGTIRWHRLTDGAELLAFFPHRDGKRWVAWTPLGHYTASPGGEDLIRWQINQGLDRSPEEYTASRFRERFYRPDVVERVLNELDPAKALAAADLAAGRRSATLKSVAADTPPRVAIIDPAEAAFVDQPALKVAYVIEDKPSTLIRRLRLLQDGRVIAEARDLTIPPGGRLAGELAVTLQDGAPTLTLLAESDKGASDPASVRLRRNVTDQDYKPALYVLAVGVNRFKDKSVPELKYAAADAADFAARLKQQERGLYRRVLVRALQNEEATAEAMRDGLEWLQREMTARDVAVVFLSTHGRNDAKGKLYFFPYDVNNRDDVSLWRSGFKADDLREPVAALADRGKVLVFLDACHSGNLAPGARGGGQADIDRVAAELGNADTGAVVFSSSSGAQFSVERAELRHGVFTYALLEAFDGKSDRPPPWLRVSDLEIWLSDRVKTLTNGAQTPKTTVPGERFTNPRVFRVGSQ